MHRQKVAEVEKLSTTVDELQEAVAAGGTAAHVNAAIRDYQRQVQELSVSPTVRQQLCVVETHPLTHSFLFLVPPSFRQDPCSCAAERSRKNLLYVCQDYSKKNVLT